MSSSSDDAEAVQWLLFFWRTGRINRKEDACGYVPGQVEENKGVSTTH
ncbi:hypothetical protein E2C01_013788 [Portunus trituberculatus]|uniref:Uncharacterized protein n=1 Tax=Portunus trituberculatus TaxID=210409 RepID=A0A5B7DI23_PORTR|nr:hypothetical protein [Portunus trituberculatus]